MSVAKNFKIIYHQANFCRRRRTPEKRSSGENLRNDQRKGSDLCRRTGVSVGDFP